MNTNTATITPTYFDLVAAPSFWLVARLDPDTLQIEADIRKDDGSWGTLIAAFGSPLVITTDEGIVTIRPEELIDVASITVGGSQS